MKFAKIMERYRRAKQQRAERLNRNLVKTARYVTRREEQIKKQDAAPDVKYWDLIPRKDDQ